MKEIKRVHIVVAGILILLSWAIVHWIILPKGGLPKTAAFSAETEQPQELPVLPQNELYNSKADSSSVKELPSFQKSGGQDVLEPKPATGNKKEEF